MSTFVSRMSLNPQVQREVVQRRAVVSVLLEGRFGVIRDGSKVLVLPPLSKKDSLEDYKE